MNAYSRSLITTLQSPIHFKGGFNAVRNVGRYVASILSSSLILSILIFIVVNFYIFASVVNLGSFFVVFFAVSVLTDGLFVLIHLPRNKVEHKKLRFDPEKLTVLICCYNGEKIITETVRQALRHVPAERIIVMSDASTDSTLSVAKSLGVRAYQNKKNLNKAFTVSEGMKHVSTPYVLILDDDTHIGDAFIPTSLLDDGYTAVAFNVMPTKKTGVLNELQMFEYRQSMQIGKNLRAKVGAIGNISGAIGLYRTGDLKRQITRHSGQYSGEDEQRTMLAHLEGTGKGVTYTDTLVTTEPPVTFKSLYRQRSYGWNLAVPELFMLYWRLLLSPKHHYLLKAEKAYQMYVFLTDPLRMLFFWALLLRPEYLLITYSFYLAMSIILWVRLGFKDSFRAVLLFPAYSLLLIVFRFIGHFYWLKVKAKYLKEKLHHMVGERKLIAEYVAVFAVLLVTWAVSGRHFVNDMQLFSKLNSHRVEQEVKDFNYDSDLGVGTLAAIPPPLPSADASYLQVPFEQGDTKRAIAHKAIDQHINETRQLPTDTSLRWERNMQLAELIPELPEYRPGVYITVEKSWVESVMNATNQGSN